MIWTLGTFRTQMRPQRAGYFSMNGGRGKAGLSGYFPIATTMIPERFNSDTVIPIHSTIFWGIVRFHDTAPLSLGSAGGACCGKGGGICGKDSALRPLESRTRAQAAPRRPSKAGRPVWMPAGIGQGAGTEKDPHRQRGGL